jgi:hypothetical protein
MRGNATHIGIANAIITGEPMPIKPKTNSTGMVPFGNEGERIAPEVIIMMAQISKRRVPHPQANFGAGHRSNQTANDRNKTEIGRKKKPSKKRELSILQSGRKPYKRTLINTPRPSQARAAMETCQDLPVGRKSPILCIARNYPTGWE